MCNHHLTPLLHNPLLCVTPPHILEEIAKRGRANHREWALRTLTHSERLRGHRDILGQMLGLFPSGGTDKRRTIFDAQGETTLPGQRVRGEGDPPSDDVQVNEAYDGAGVTYDLYKNEFNRNSIDSNGLRLDSTVHYDQQFNNAFWNGQQMVYGDGDGELFKRFTIAVDVIGHELTHGVTQYSAGLVYKDQSGALNESISDVFGSLVKQYNLKQTAEEADWLIGAGLLGDGVNGKALRSMSAPGTAYDDQILGKDPQPAHIKHYVKTSSDSGGVHINSGIPNHAFYILATTLKGNAWEKAGQIWYRALQMFQPTTNFQSAAEITLQAARVLYNTGSREEQAVKDAWNQVGISAS